MLLLSKKGGNAQTSRNDRHLPQNLIVRKYAIAMLVALAMSESIGIYGFVLFLLGRDVLDLYLLNLVSAAAMFTYRPKRDEIINLGNWKVS